MYEFVEGHLKELFLAWILIWIESIFCWINGFTICQDKEGLNLMKPRYFLVGFIYINKHTHTPKLVATLKNRPALQFNKTEIIVSLKKNKIYIPLLQNYRTLNIDGFVFLHFN